jgi:hypothetical protein
MSFFARTWRAIVYWFDYKIVYPLFAHRFSKKFAENPKMRKAFMDYWQQWEVDHAAKIEARRATFSVVQAEALEPGAARADESIVNTTSPGNGG